MVKISRYTRASAALLAIAASLSSCGWLGTTSAELRTDVPQMALYAAAFNTSQGKYSIDVTYDEDLAASLAERGPKPALVVGRYLKSSQSRSVFQSLDHLFSSLVINQSAFYPSLLELGNAEGRQLLLPVSFNLPLVVFDKGQEAAMKDKFVIDMAELKEKGAAFNKKSKTMYSAMGFGPRWSPEFMYEALKLSGVDFKEGSPLKWNKEALSAGLAYLRAWSDSANESGTKEEEFQFKYLYLPEYKSVEEGRIGYAVMDSSKFFVISEERRSALSFRWLAKDGAVPIADDAIYAGICRGGKGKPAAEAFLKWFYSEETQKSLLDEGRRYRSMESSFGIAGGFSSIRAVNEKLFPVYYPSLLGKLPPERYLKTPTILPSSWPTIKEEVLLPFLLDATGTAPAPDATVDLNARMEAWLKKHASY